MIYLADTSSLNNLNTFVLIGVALVVGVFTLVRGRADVWKSNYEGEKARADGLQVDKENQLADNVKLKERITQLEAQPNLDRLVKLMNDHDDRAARRNKAVLEQSQKTIAVLEKIAKSIK